MNTKQLNDVLVSLLAVSFSLLAFLNIRKKKTLRRFRFVSEFLLVFYSVLCKVFYNFYSKHFRYKRSNLNIKYNP